jgi:hypothetical protein
LDIDAFLTGATQYLATSSPTVSAQVSGPLQVLLTWKAVSSDTVAFRVRVYYYFPPETTSLQMNFYQVLLFDALHSNF